MVSPITNQSMHNRIYLLIFAILQSGCAVKYFQQDIPADVHHISDPIVREYLPTGFPDDYEKYEVNMQSLYYYKNNIQENVLMTRYSQLTEKIQFFPLTDTKRPDKFQRFEIWLSKRDHTHHVSTLIPGENVIMVSYKGKNTPNGAMYEIVKVYLGKITTRQAIINASEGIIFSFRPDLLLDYTGQNTKGTIKKCQRKNKNCQIPDGNQPVQKSSQQTDAVHVQKPNATWCNEHCHKVNRKITTRQGKAALNMEAFIDFVRDPDQLIKVQGKPVIEFRALVDKNHNAIGGEKQMIFDMSQIYGEPVWLIKEK